MNRIDEIRARLHNNYRGYGFSGSWGVAVSDITYLTEENKRMEAEIYELKLLVKDSADYIRDVMKFFDALEGKVTAATLSEVLYMAEGGEE